MSTYRYTCGIALYTYFQNRIVRKCFENFQKMYICNGYSNTGNMNISVDNLNQIKIRRYATVFNLRSSCNLNH